MKSQDKKFVWMRTLLIVTVMLYRSTSTAQEKFLSSDSIPIPQRGDSVLIFQIENLSVDIKVQHPRSITLVEAVLHSTQQRIGSRISKLGGFHRKDSVMAARIQVLQFGADSIKGLIIGGANLNDVGSIELLERTVRKAQGIGAGNLDILKSDSAQIFEKARPELERITSSFDDNITSLSPDILSSNVTDLANVSSETIAVPNIDFSLPELKISSLEGAKSSGILEKIESIPESPEMLRSKVEDFVQFDEVKAKLEEADKLKRYYDPDVAKEEAMNKAKLEAVNHFAGHEEELKAAMEKLSQLKSKIPDPDGVLDLFAKRQRTMAGKSFGQRLTPGLTFQLQKQRSIWVDLNPYVGIRITGRLTWGLGWNERFAFDTQAPAWKKNERMFGPRTFLHYKLRQNLWLKGDFEKMNVARNADPELQTWVWSCFAGIKKDFKLSKRLSGNMQVLYGWHDPEYPNPYAERINVRIGFELPKLRNDNLPR